MPMCMRWNCRYGENRRIFCQIGYNNPFLMIVFMPKEILYRILYHQHNEPCELYARSVSESDMFGFIELEELVFEAIADTDHQEKLKQEFDGVKRTYIPLSNVCRIDTIERDDEVVGQGKRSTIGNVTVFPANAKNAHVKPHKD